LFDHVTHFKKTDFEFTYTFTHAQARETAATRSPPLYRQATAKLHRSPDRRSRDPETAIQGA
jgi:hypothetical protein